MLLTHGLAMCLAPVRTLTVQALQLECQLPICFLVHRRPLACLHYPQLIQLAPLARALALAPVLRLGRVRMPAAQQRDLPLQRRNWLLLQALVLEALMPHGRARLHRCDCTLALVPARKRGCTATMMMLSMFAMSPLLLPLLLCFELLQLRERRRSGRAALELTRQIRLVGGLRPLLFIRQLLLPLLLPL